MLKIITNLFKKTPRRKSISTSAEAHPGETEAIAAEASSITTNLPSATWLGASTSWKNLYSKDIGNLATEYSATIEYPENIWNISDRPFLRTNLFSPQVSAIFNWEELSNNIFDESQFVGRENESAFPVFLDQRELAESRQEEQKQRFLKRLFFLFETIDFEYGIRNEADEFVEEYLSLNPTQTKEWLECFYLENFHKAANLVKLLRTIARIEYQKIFPQGQVIATSALTHEDIEVKECGVRAFESWASLESLKILEHLEVAEKWLQDYINEVVEYLRRDFDVAIHKED